MRPGQAGPSGADGAPGNPDEFTDVLAFHRALCIPRATGTDGARVAEDLVRDRFAAVPGGAPGEQPFTTSRLYMAGVLNVIHPVIGGLMLLVFGLVALQLHAVALVVAIGECLVALFNRQIIWALQFRVVRRGKQYPSRNLWVTLPPRGEVHQTLVLVSHHDSISHVLSPVVEALGYLAGFLGGVLFGIHSLIYLVPVVFGGLPAAPLAHLAWGVPVAAVTFIELFNGKGNESQGALDNASAVAQGYHLARAVATHPLEHTRLVVLATGAEEWGDVGAYHFVTENPLGLDQASARFVIVDTIGADADHTLIYGIGWPVKHWSPFLERHARALAETTPAPVSMMSIPPLLQVATDHVPIERAGYEFLVIASNLFIIHGPKDNLSAFQENTFRAMCEFVEAYVRRLDASGVPGGPEGANVPGGAKVPEGARGQAETTGREE